MKILSDNIVDFFNRQNFVIVSTIDKDGGLHSSCKGIVKINKNGKIYLLDLYKKRTFENLKKNHRIALTGVDEHSFDGYCLKGKAKIIKQNELNSNIIKAWEEKIVSRITHRVLKNIRGEKGHPRHPETLLPMPEYLIFMEVEKIIDLTPRHLKW